MRDWAYLATAPNETIAEMWCEMLIDNGIAAKLQPADTISFIGVSTKPVRVMVAARELEAAKALMARWEDEEPEAEETGESDGAGGR